MGSVSVFILKITPHTVLRHKFLDLSVIYVPFDLEDPGSRDDLISGVGLLVFYPGALATRELISACAALRNSSR